MHAIYSIVIRILVLGIFLFGLLQVRLPNSVGLLLVQVGENKIEDIRVPSSWMPLDAFLDVLQNVSIVILMSRKSMAKTYIWKLEPIRHVVLWEDDGLRSSPTGSNSLLAKTANSENLASDSEFTSHGNRRIERLVESQ